MKHLSIVIVVIENLFIDLCFHIWYSHIYKEDFNMNTRIKEIRTALDLTLEKFCKPLGISRSAMSNIENGNRNVTQQLCKSICHVNWNGKLVNEEWLRTGNGPMFLELPEENKYFKAATQLSNDPLIVSIITGYYQLDIRDRLKIKNLIKQLYESIIEQENKEHED